MVVPDRCMFKQGFRLELDFAETKAERWTFLLLFARLRTRRPLAQFL